jgi:2-amino-4-hydroxy-6-hydroxymethyldihydropteridine diphosphokinase
MPCVYLGLGSNLGARAHHMARALVCLALDPQVDLVRVSPVYETAPWGVEDQPAFLNMAAQVRTTLAPLELLGRVKAIEQALGRKAGPRWGPRVVDIDLLFAPGTTLTSDALSLPHLHLAERQFVLVPLADIAPDIDLGDGRTPRQLARPDDPDLTLLGPLAQVLRIEAGRGA